MKAQAKLLTKEEFAVSIRKSTRTVDRLVKEGFIVPTKVGRRIYIHSHSPAQIINIRNQKPAA